MSNRKATFAKRNREMELKEHAKNKEARREQRKQASDGRESKGPEIAWDQAVDQSAVINASNFQTPTASLVPRDDSAVTAPEPPKPSQNHQPHLQPGSAMSSSSSSSSSSDPNQQN